MYWMIAVDNPDLITLGLIALGIGAIIAGMSYTATCRAWRNDVGITEEAGKVGSAAMAMQSQPLAIALLIVNCAFLGFAGYVLGEVSENAKARNVTQMDLIGKLVSTFVTVARAASRCARSCGCRTAPSSRSATTADATAAAPR